ncbi:MAG: helix-turn-helix domain-containing protein [Syntrophorhabdales bacterium]
MEPEGDAAATQDVPGGLPHNTVEDKARLLGPHQLLTAAEVAEILRFAVGSVYQLVHRKKIPYVKICGALRFRKSDIEAWIEKCTFRPGQKEEPRKQGGTKRPRTKKSSKARTEVTQMVEQSRRKYLDP